ncbi:MAG: hypothetical protein JSR85_02645 [Proteobacteria bacterium]|nr:hypothetical protein [Pseudomonadota bacterium]
MKALLTTTLALGFIIVAGSGTANAWYNYPGHMMVGSTCGSCNTCEPACAPVCKPCAPVCKINCDYGLCRPMLTY